jgi:hypothetical protein
MNGYCKTLSAFFGPRFNPSDDTWDAIKVYRDGNEHVIAAGFATEEEAEQAAGREHAQEIAANSQFGVGA